MRPVFSIWFFLTSLFDKRFLKGDRGQPLKLNPISNLFSVLFSLSFEGIQNSLILLKLHKGKFDFHKDELNLRKFSIKMPSSWDKFWQNAFLNESCLVADFCNYIKRNNDFRELTRGVRRLYIFGFPPKSLQRSPRDS
jgi:hypothetical protein